MSTGDTKGSGNQYGRSSSCQVQRIAGVREIYCNLKHG